MIDDSVSPAEPADSPDSGVKVYASVASLAVNGTAPEIGDEVDLTIKGTVNSIDGDVACVSPTEVNGEPAPAAPAAEEPAADDPNAERDKLRSQVVASDGSY